MGFVPPGPRPAEHSLVVLYNNRKQCLRFSLTFPPEAGYSSVVVVVKPSRRVPGPESMGIQQRKLSLLYTANKSGKLDVKSYPVWRGQASRVSVCVFRGAFTIIVSPKGSYVGDKKCPVQKRIRN